MSRPRPLKVATERKESMSATDIPNARGRSGARSLVD
jgi:hypothetical protein